MTLRLGTAAPSKLYLGSIEVTKAYLGASEIYSSAAPPAAWTPADLGASLALWLDADDASTITLNGSDVSQWDDKSGNGRNATQAVAASQPTYAATGFNSKPTLQFDGTSDFMRADAAAVAIGSQAFTLMSAARFPTAGFLFSLRESAGGTTRGYIQRANANELNSAWGDPSVSPPVLSVVDSTNNILGAQKRTGGVVESFANGVGGGTATASFSAPFAVLALGAFSTTITNNWSNSWFSEIVIATGTMTTADRQKLEGYLAWKWGGI